MDDCGQFVAQGHFDVSGGLGHGGEGETSISLAIVPELVDMSLAKGMIPEMDENVKLIWNFQELTDFGASGAPQKGTVEKGKKMKQVLVYYLVDFVEKMDKTDWKCTKKAYLSE